MAVGHSACEGYLGTVRFKGESMAVHGVDGVSEDAVCDGLWEREWWVCLYVWHTRGMMGIETCRSSP